MINLSSSPVNAQSNTAKDSSTPTLSEILKDCNHCYELAVVQDSVIKDQNVKIQNAAADKEDHGQKQRTIGRLEGAGGIAVLVIVLKLLKL